MICPHCKKEIMEESSFCEFCGAKIHEEKPAVDEQIDKSPVSVEKKFDFHPEEFKGILEILKDPLSEHHLGLIPSIVILIIALIVNCIFCMKNFMYGLLMTLVVFGGGVLMVWLGDSGHFDWKKAIGDASSTMLISTLLLLILCLTGSFRFSSLSDVNLSMIFITAIVIAAVVLYCLMISAKAPKLHPYLRTLILTCIITLCIYFFMKGLIAAVYSSWNMIF